MFVRTPVLMQAWRAAQTRNVCLLTALCTLLVGPACLSDAQRLQSGELLDQLVSARDLFSQQPPQADAACNRVGSVQTRLFGEPGLVDVRPAWPALRDAAAALQAVCGQMTLLDNAPSGASFALDLGRQRWQQGIVRGIDVACDHLRDAAVALGRGTPC